MSVLVRVPIADAVAWDPWLTEELGDQAQRLGLGYDGGEEDGPFEVFDFEGDPAQVEQAVLAGLKTAGVHRTITRESNVITVARNPDTRWLVPLSPKSGAYDKALHRVAKEMSDDAELKAWFVGTGMTAIQFQESNTPGRPALFHDSDEPGVIFLMHYADLTIVDRTPKKAEAEQVAREHLHSVLTQVAGHLGHPLP
jgi:hypothetical protein